MAYFALIGKSLKHSFSATYFNQKFKTEGLDHKYVNMEMEQVEYLSNILKFPDLVGLNVTLPYKSAVIPFLDGITPLAQRIGAVNTIFRHKDGWFGHNTDYTGFIDSLMAWAWTNGRIDIFKNKLPALVMGNGGAAQSVKVALKELKFEIHLAVRTINESLTDHQLLYQDLNDQINKYGLLVNTTPVGTWPNVDEVLPLPFSEISAQHHIYDLIYNPEQTKLMQLAIARDATAQNGSEMLISQAKAAWQIWSGETDPFSIK